MTSFDDLQNQLNRVWNGWKIDELLGEGSFGSVYRISREEFGHIYESALKIITIPQTQSEARAVLNEGMDEDSVRTYFYSIVEKIIEEFTLMQKLRGNTNIVSYEDHAVIPVDDGIGWNIFIRMEMLTPLIEYFSDNTLPVRGIIQMGIDICSALEVCQKYNIIHRDIKPENIFVSTLGSFKLGDFGIAKQMEKSTGSLSKQGTVSYMAPEVYKGEHCGSTVDIYSLGMVMYRFLNNNRIPFLPPYPEPITYADKEEANIKRMSGAALPPPCNANGRLTEIILKACEYDISDRYQSAVEMKKDLTGLLRSIDEDATVTYIETASSTCESSVITDGTGTEENNPGNNIHGKKNRRKENHDKENSEDNNIDGNPGKVTNHNKRILRGTAAVMTIIVAVLLCLFLKNRYTTVPDLSGLTLAEASEMASGKEYGLVIVSDKEQYSSEVDKGRIIFQNYPVGDKIKKGNYIKVVVSKGLLIKVPNLVGFDIKEAENIAEASGLSVVVNKRIYSDDISNGRVLSQSIEAGTVTDESAVINVVVSMGKETVIVPNVVGMSAEDAKRSIDMAGLKCEISEQYDETVKADIIISQDVEAGIRVEKNTTVRILVSLGSKPVEKTANNGSKKTNESKNNSDDEIMWGDVE